MTEARRSPLWAAIAGGIVGAALTALILLFAAPQIISSRIVRQGMLADPQILVDTAEALQERQYEPVLDANRAALETPFGSSWEGAKEPEVTLVEFFDYACGYCRASLPHIERLLKEDPGLRVVYREMPILGPDSVAAARVSLAASRQGRFETFHDTLFASGRPGPETISKAANAAGVPPQPQDDPHIEAELRRNFQLASELGASGTPMFVVGNKVLNGAVGYEALKQAIADARKQS